MVCSAAGACVVPLNPPASAVSGGAAKGEVASLTLHAILAQERLEFVFQPIVDISDSQVFGYEALMRGPAGSHLYRPDDLLAAAREAGRLVELECAAVAGAIAAFGRSGLTGRLFLNLSAAAMCDFVADNGSALFGYMVKAGVSPKQLMIELTEHERVPDPEHLRQALNVFTAQDIGFALDDFGDGRSSLRLWAELQPDIVKLDKYFVRDVHRDSRKVDVVRALLGLAERFGTQVVAEGIETIEELIVLRDLGCRYAQGYLLGRPLARPALSLPERVCEALGSHKIAVLPNSAPQPARGHTVARLRVEAPVIFPGTSNEEVRRLFSANPELHAVAVVEKSYPVGLIHRRGFLDRYAQPFYHELFGRRSCVQMMNAEPLRVERTVPIDSMAAMLAGEDQRYLFEGFILTDCGHYDGLATGESLVRAVTEQRIEAARHANPLTSLPGNIPITEHIRRLLAAPTRFVACYFDLNDFKPFNDRYGYWRGDEMIKFAAAAIVRESNPLADFVGHVGGDDFVVLFQSEDWLQRCERILRDFTARARTLFNPQDLAHGGFESEDRCGVKVFFSLTCMAVGAVEVVPGRYCSPEEVASAAADAKNRAKKRPDGVYVQGCTLSASSPVRVQ